MILEGLAIYGTGRQTPIELCFAPVHMLLWTAIFAGSRGLTMAITSLVPSAFQPRGARSYRTAAFRLSAPLIPTVTEPGKLATLTRDPSHRCAYRFPHSAPSRTGD
jgi:hypothetical protein